MVLEDYPFASRLSTSLRIDFNPESAYEDLRRQLVEDYCFDVDSILVSGERMSLTVVFPKNYNPIRKEHVMEIISYHKPCGILMESGYIEDGTIFLDGKVHQVEIIGEIV